MSSSALAIDMIVVAAGETRLAAYVEQTFPEEASLGRYTADNAADWLDVDKFTRWLTQPVPQKTAQSSGASHNTTSSCAGRISEESNQSHASSRKR
ncbi:hypothetical protein C8F04DRAFT_1256428 [Mycena alexandri]|uniref:Uncharacterized protein n=1 Tax=Mycena alexandri TaxID=1745969 RepID=A0AAD6XAA3_9AGAR|nr:hypothetical protein C8F04DRAFT_1256428 [Mycena alexandri]